MSLPGPHATPVDLSCLGITKRTLDVEVPVPVLSTGDARATLQCMGFSEWARRLDDRVAVPMDRKINPPWMRTSLGRWGMSMLIFGGGGFLLRVLFSHAVHTATWALAVYAIVGVTGLAMLIVARHRVRSHSR